MSFDHRKIIDYFEIQVILSNADLSYADLSGAKLRHADLSRMTSPYTTFMNANLSDAKIISA
ncbi:MAG: pentapeptide repeat-containing protein, partial [Candidatus Nitrosopolaris sp.]